MVSSVRYDTSTKTLNQIANGKQDQKTNPLWQTDTNMFRSSPVKHTPAVYKPDYQNALAAQLFTSSEDDCQTSDNYVLGEEDGEDPLTYGDSDFEPAEHATRTVVAQPRQHNNFFDLEVGHTSQFDQGRGDMYTEMDQKLHSEHEAALRLEDNAAIILQQRSFQKNSENQKIQSHPTKNQNTTKQVPAKQRSSLANKQKPEQEPLKPQSSDDEADLQSDMQQSTRQQSSNVRRFARNTGTYQASFSKQSNYQKQDRYKNDSSYSSEENDTLISQDFRGKYFIDARDIEMQQIQNSSVFETDFYANAAKVKMDQNWAAETYKNTGVGFTPAAQVQTLIQEKGSTLTSFGWNGVEKKPVATFETAQQMRENKQKSPAQDQVYEYGAMMYPQKQISEAVWAEQNKNMVKPTVTKERKKKKKDNEAHFLLTGQFAQYMEHRSFFKNSDDLKQKVNAVDHNNKEALIEWFDSLSLQDRINSCTTTYPIIVNSILDAQQKHIRIDGPLCLLTLKKDKNVDTNATDGATRRRQMQETEQSIFERVPSQDDRYRGHNIYCGAQTSVRSFQTKIIKLVRITTNKQPNDTLTVCPDLVRDTQEFFSLIENITDGKAFAQPVSYVSKHGGKPQIQSPKWIDASKSNFLGVWLIAMIEESLWAHFNYSRQVNIHSSVRKQELNQLFELRSENLNDQELLAQRWLELGEDGQHKILQQLSATAREEPPSKFNQIYDEQERKQNYQQQQYNEDIFSLCQYGRHGIFNFQEVTREDYYTKHYEQQSGSMNNYHIYQCADKFLMQCQHDSDLKEIIDLVQYIGSLELIKFLSEFPLYEIHQRNYVRKHYLCQQLHLLIQANLRQSIQDQLINDMLNLDSDKNMSLELDPKKSKKKQFDNRRKKNNQKQQQTYQKKKSISKSPQRDPVVVQPAPQPKKQQQPQKPDDKRLASTTTSDDQHVEKKGQQKHRLKKNQQKSQEAIATAKLLVAELVDSVIQQITTRELKAAESSEEQQEPEPAAISKVVAKPENVPSKPRRKNKKPKKQDAEELVNNFVRKINGDDDDLKAKNSKKQPVLQQKQQQHSKTQQKAVTVQTPKQEPKKIEKSIEKAKQKKPSPVKEVIKPELQETKTSIIFQVEQTEPQTQIPYLEQTEDVISMQPQKEEPLPIREKISLTDHFSTTLRDFQIDENAQMNFTQEWPNKPANLMSTTSVSFTPNLAALQVSPLSQKTEILDYHGSPILNQKFAQLNSVPIQPIAFYNQSQPQQYAFDKPSYPFRPPEYQKVLKNKPAPFRQPQYYPPQMINHSPTSSDFQYETYQKNKSGIIEPPFFQPFGPIGSPHPLDLTSSSNSASNPKDAQIRLDAPSFEPIQKIHSEDYRAWNYQQPQYQPVKQQFNDQLPPQQHPLYLQIEDNFYRSFDKDIEQQTIKIQNFIEKFQEERCYVIERLQQMANAAFPGRTPTIKVFGSLMTGLALESSDMDIAVTGLRIDDREDMIDDLNALGDQVQKWALVRDYKSIETASIPVIKAHLRLQDIAKEMGKAYNHPDPDVELPIDITFDDSPEPTPVQSTQQPIYIQEPFILQPPVIQKPTDPMTQLQNLISGELGFNIQDSLIGFGMEFGGPPPPKTHLGLASCALLKDYVRTYPHLKEVAILLKRFLTVNNLNQSYLGKILSNLVGGISSYSAVLLVVAYMNNFKLQQSPHLTPSRLLMGFLDFYSNCFDPRHYGVNTSKGMSFYPLPQMNQQMFVIVDPVNPTNNTARNSFRTPDVLAHFRAAFYSLKSQITKQFQKQLADPDWGDSFSLAGQPAKFEKPAEQRPQKHGKNGKALVDPVKAAMEQQVPSSNGATVAFDSVNFVEHFLSNDILRQGSDKQAVVMEALSGFGVAF